MTWRPSIGHSRICWTVASSWHHPPLPSASRCRHLSDLDICQKSEDTRYQLLASNLPIKVFVEVVSRLGTEDSQLTGVSCLQGHGMTGLRKRMAASLFNLFAGNMVRDMNSAVHAKGKADATPGQVRTKVTRTQCDDKRRKLTVVTRC